MPSYDVATPSGQSYHIDADSDAQAQTAINSILGDPTKPQHSLAQFGRNVGKDLAGNALGLGMTLKQGLYDIPKAVAQTPAQVLQGTPLAQTGLGQQLKQLRNQIPGIIAETKEAVTNPVEYGYQKPVSQALNLMALGGIAEKGLGLAGREAMELPKAFTAPSNPEILDIAQKHGIDLPAGDITGSSTQKSVESLASKFPFSSNVFKERYAQNNASVRGMVDKFVGNARLPEEVGPAIKESFIQGSKTANEIQKEMYKRPAAVAEGPIPLQKTMQTAQTLLSEQQELPEPQRNSNLLNLLEYYTKGEQFPKGSQEGYVMQAYNSATPQMRATMENDPNLAPIIKRGQMPTKDYNTVQTIMSDLKDRIRMADAAQRSGAPGAAGMSSMEAGVYKRLLKDGLTPDLKAYSEKTGGQFKQLLDQANHSYSIFKQNYGDNDYLKSVYSEQNPVKAFTKAVEPDNPVAVNTLKGNLNAPLQDEVERATIRQMGEKTPGVFSQKEFVENYQKYGDANLKRFFSPENFKNLRELYVASKATLEAEANAASTSGKGFGSVIGLASPVYSFLRGAATRGGAMVGGEAGVLPAAAKGYLGKGMTQILSQQPVTALPKTMATLGALKTAGQAVSGASKGAALERGAAMLGNARTPLDEQRLQEMIQRLKKKYDRRRQM